MCAQPVARLGKDEGIPPRERILAAAAELFYRHGIRAVGVEAIAEGAGTNKMPRRRITPRAR
jgi:AcrR family transcriptional regulator